MSVEPKELEEYSVETRIKAKRIMIESRKRRQEVIQIEIDKLEEQIKELEGK